MLPQSQFESPMLAPAQAPVAIAALTQDRALIGLLRSTLDPSHDLILVTSEAELAPHLNSRRVSAALLDSMFIEGDLGALAEQMRETWPDLVLVVVGTAEEQSKVASQITSGVVYRFLHRPVSAPRVRLFVEAALRRHEVENVERTLEHVRPDFTQLEAARSDRPRKRPAGLVSGAIAAAALAVVAGVWFASSGSDDAGIPGATEVVSTDDAVAESATAPQAVAPQVQIPEELPMVAPAPARTVESRDEAAADGSSPAATESLTSVVELPVETAPQTPPPPPVLTHEQRLREQLAQAEAALQRGELATPPGRNAVELFRGALDLDPANTLAKAGLVRVADRLLSAAERALTAGNPEDARSMVAVAESLTPATSRAAFIMMQIDMERERAVLTSRLDVDAADKLEKGTTYLRLANARLRSGALIEPSQDNARFYLEAARQVVPDDPAVAETGRALQKELLGKAAAAAVAGSASDTERWLANADSAGASRPEMGTIRRSLQESLIGARSGRLDTLTQAFTTALAANRLLQPADNSAKAHLLSLIDTDTSAPAVATARQGLGAALLRELRAALARNDLTAAGVWLDEARTIGYVSAELESANAELDAARAVAANRSAVVGANSLARIEYVAPKFPMSTRNRDLSGWVELEFTVLTDGSTGDIVVTNSSPRKMFDASAVNAVREWRYTPVMRGGKPVEQRAAVRIRFAEER